MSVRKKQKACVECGKPTVGVLLYDPLFDLPIPVDCLCEECAVEILDAEGLDEYATSVESIAALRMLPDIVEAKEPPLGWMGQERVLTEYENFPLGKRKGRYVGPN